MTDTNSFIPIAAFDMDGVIRVRKTDAVELISFPITMYKEEYPTLFHGKPRWDENGESTQMEHFSKPGVELLRRIAANPAMEPVLATTWQRWANHYFAKPLGIRELPVAVKTLHPEGQNWYHCSPGWKSSQLARQFDGRPLIWIDDSPTDHPGEDLIYNRRPIDRAITLFYKVDSWTGLTAKDAVAIEEWLTLASSPEGHKILRARRVKEQAAKKAQYLKWKRESLRKHAHFLEVFSRAFELFPDNEELARSLGRLAEFRDGLTSENVGYALKRAAVEADSEELSAKLRIQGFHSKRSKSYEDEETDF